MNTLLGDRAVVLGGSIAGLLAARVLADHYPEVIVVERDELPAGAAHRRGVPQGRHIHALLARGQQVLDELLPGFTAELVARGAPAGDVLDEARHCFGGHRFRRRPSGLTAVCATRPALEDLVRARVRALPAVRILDRCDVVGFATTPDATRVTGARVLRRADGSAEEVVDADLVVDATGRGSRTPARLEALGHPRPRVDEVRIGVGYATRLYHLAPGAIGGDLAVLVGPTPEHPRGGALQAVEGGRHLLTLFGVLGDHPPTDPDGFDAFAASLRFPDIAEAIADGHPLDAPVAFRYPASVRHRYERLSRVPDGLLVTGDALCSFNPIYGQGMSVAALEALALRRHLERGTRPRPARVQADLGRVVDVPWSSAAGGDLAFPEVEGRRTMQTRVVNRYIGRVLTAAGRDAEVGRAFVRVSGLVDPPGALLRPRMVTRVLRQSGRRLTAPGPPAGAAGNAGSSRSGSSAARPRSGSGGERRVRRAGT